MCVGSIWGRVVSVVSWEKYLSFFILSLLFSQESILAQMCGPELSSAP